MATQIAICIQTLHDREVPTMSKDDKIVREVLELFPVLGRLPESVREVVFQRGRVSERRQEKS